jgi:hypothetical protein
MSNRFAGAQSGAPREGAGTPLNEAPHQLAFEAAYGERRIKVVVTFRESLTVAQRIALGSALMDAMYKAAAEVGGEPQGSGADPF